MSDRTKGIISAGVTAAIWLFFVISRIAGFDIPAFVPSLVTAIMGALGFKLWVFPNLPNSANKSVPRTIRQQIEAEKHNRRITGR